MSWFNEVGKERIQGRGLCMNGKMEICLENGSSVLVGTEILTGLYRQERNYNVLLLICVG